MSYDIEREVIYRNEVSMTEDLVAAGMPHTTVTVMVHSDDSRIVIEENNYYPGHTETNRVSLDFKMIGIIARMALQSAIGHVPSDFSLTNQSLLKPASIPKPLPEPGTPEHAKVTREGADAHAALKPFA